MGTRLSALVEKSLVIYEERDERYRLLETVRQYARERLLDDGEVEALRSRQLEFFTRLAERRSPSWRGRPRRSVLELQGDRTAGLGLFEEALAAFRGLEDRQGVAMSLDGLANLLLSQAMPPQRAHISMRACRYAVCWATGEAYPHAWRGWRNHCGTRPRDGWSGRHVSTERRKLCARKSGRRCRRTSENACERDTAEVRAALGEESYAAVWSKGRAMSLEEAVACASERRIRTDASSRHPRTKIGGAMPGGPGKLLL